MDNVSTSFWPSKSYGDGRSANCHFRTREAGGRASCGWEEKHTICPSATSRTWSRICSAMVKLGEADKVLPTMRTGFRSRLSASRKMPGSRSDWVITSRLDVCEWASVMFKNGSSRKLQRGSSREQLGLDLHTAHGQNSLEFPGHRRSPPAPCH